MSIYIYCRVSSNKQVVDTQEHDLLKRYPEAFLYRETASGVKERPELEKLLKKIQSGDTLAIAALDRLGRKLLDIIGLIEGLYKRGVNIVSLREGVDYSTPSGRFTAQAMVMVAELERSLISQRTKAALQAKKEKGQRLGPPGKHSVETLTLAMNMRNDGHTFNEISKATGMSKGSVVSLFNKKSRNPIQSDFLREFLR